MSADAGSDGVFTAEPGTAWRQRAELAADVGRLVADLLRDPRVPAGSKALVGAGAAGAAGAVVRAIVRRRLVGALEVGVLAVAVRRLIADAGYELIREHWRGSDAGFAWVLALGGVAR